MVVKQTSPACNVLCTEILVSSQLCVKYIKWEHNGLVVSVHLSVRKPQLQNNSIFKLNFVLESLHWTLCREFSFGSYIFNINKVQPPFTWSPNETSYFFSNMAHHMTKFNIITSKWSCYSNIFPSGECAYLAKLKVEHITPAHFMCRCRWPLHPRRVWPWTERPRIIGLNRPQDLTVRPRFS